MKHNIQTKRIGNKKGNRPLSLEARRSNREKHRSWEKYRCKQDSESYKEYTKASLSFSIVNTLLKKSADISAFSPSSEAIILIPSRSVCSSETPDFVFLLLLRVTDH
jgi:hypothetical protein